MAVTKVDNTASVTYNGSTISSNLVETVLLLAPTILKAVDKLLASVGDVLTYTITVTNPGLSAITNLPFSDTLGAGAAYVPNSFKVNGTAATPTVTGQVITYTIPSIAALGSAVITIQATISG